MDDATLVSLAEKHSTTVGNVVVSWHKQRGIVAVPKSTNAGRVASNVTTPAVALSGDEMAMITALGHDAYRVCPDPELIA